MDKKGKFKVGEYVRFIDPSDAWREIDTKDPIVVLEYVEDGICRISATKKWEYRRHIILDWRICKLEYEEDLRKEYPVIKTLKIIRSIILTILERL